MQKLELLLDVPDLRLHPLGLLQTLLRRKANSVSLSGSLPELRCHKKVQKHQSSRDGCPLPRLLPPPSQPPPPLPPLSSQPRRWKEGNDGNYPVIVLFALQKRAGVHAIYKIKIKYNHNFIACRVKIHKWACKGCKQRGTENIHTHTSTQTHVHHWWLLLSCTLKNN